MTSENKRVLTATKTTHRFSLQVSAHCVLIMHHKDSENSAKETPCKYIVSIMTDPHALPCVVNAWYR